MGEARRRIGAGVAVVAGVVAGSLGLAGPVAAQEGAGPDSERVPTVVVRVTSAAVAGSYTVSWRTLGGCDPGPGTSGMAGEVTLTVEADGQAGEDAAPGELTGTPDVEVVLIRPFCVYAWSVSVTESTTGGNCVVGPAPFAPGADNRLTITLEDPETHCTQQSRIVVRLNAAVPAGVDETDHNALLRSRFLATARGVEGAPPACRTRTGISRVDDRDTPEDSADDTVSIELPVVATTADGEACRYDVTLRVPRFLIATHGDAQHEVFEDVDPQATIDFRVGVSTKTIYLLQTVTGDAGGAAARYDLTLTCGEADASGLPEPLLPRPAAGGIQPIQAVPMVELREGRFNITAALAADPDAPDAFNGAPRRVLDPAGETCDATVTVSQLPEHCTAEATDQTVDLSRSPEPTIIEFKITCGQSAEAGEPHRTPDA